MKWFKGIGLLNDLNWPVLSWFVLIILIILFYYNYEKKGSDSKTVAVAATLSALAAVSRVPFAALPNVQPTTFIVIVSGYVFGAQLGFIVGSTAAVVSNMSLGQGPWTPWQMLAWGCAGMSAGVLKHFRPKISKAGLTFFCGLWGYIFGLIMNIWQWSAFIYPLTLKTFFATYLLGFWFDSLHALSNVLLAVFMGKDLIKILDRFQKKLKATYLPPEYIE
ncbi:MAG: energy-coupling factor transport system substrate-specific component [Thermosediminibacterales bacterium]|nr:energy-coupling factor transport system substrate-specific component [Thermosediminibacterales bacterium]MDK2836102.1 energy-coupling factor transport system substrate-specific component [Thermosediminibacterales bacterium]